MLTVRGDYENKATQEMAPDPLISIFENITTNRSNGSNWNKCKYGNIEIRGSGAISCVA